MSRNFDVVVIGTGAAGSTVAYACRSAGRSVAIIDSRPFGGTCALRGCDPKKVMVGVADSIEQHNRLLGRGVPGVPLQIDWPKLAAFKDTFTESVPESQTESFEGAGIVTYSGRALFISPNEIGVGSEILIAGQVMIATGAAPMDLGVPGADLVITSDDWLDLKDLPKRVAFVGGGFISFEFAHIANAAGADVTIFNRGPRPLKPFDPDLVEAMVGAARARGIKIKNERVVSEIERDGKGFLVKTKTTGGGEESDEADLVVHGAGRVPQTADLNLAAGEVESGRRGVKVNNRMQSVSNPAVFAAGDVADSGPPLTPVASYEAEIAAANILDPDSREADKHVVPSIVYTIPALGSVGISEAAAEASGLVFRVNQGQTAGWYSNRRVGEEYGAYKVLIDGKSDLILGAHIFGIAAEEQINVFSLAMANRITASELKKTIFAYPTFSSDIQYLL